MTPHDLLLLQRHLHRESHSWRRASETHVAESPMRRARQPVAQMLLDPIRATRGCAVFGQLPADGADALQVVVTAPTLLGLGETAKAGALLMAPFSLGLTMRSS